MNSDSPQTVHIPVLAEECLAALALETGHVVVDGTLGGAGHSRLILDQIGDRGHLIAMDRDTAALSRAEALLSGTPTTLVHGNFCDLPDYLPQLGVATVDAVLLDLGLSSDQLSDANRGFSFDADAPLDLRFDTSRGEPASRLLQRLTAEHLADLIYAYGEERYSRRIARAVVDARRSEPIVTAKELSQLVRRVIRRSKRDRIDPATRTFQALRIAVNEELKSLEIALRRLPDCVKIGGRLAIISFHSLEDRRVKEAFRDDDRWQPITKKPIQATAAEVEKNPRSRSAKLRVAERVAT